MFKFTNIQALLFSIVILLMILAINISETKAARTSDSWQERFGTYIETSWEEGRDILINGVNKYLNFGTFSGETGYGIRDNAGTIECKDDGGSWSACQDGNSGIGGSGLATTSIDTEAELETILTDVTNVYTNNDGNLNDDNLSNNTTSDLAEGSNLYHTLGRIQTILVGGYNAIFGNSTTTNLSITSLTGCDTLDTDSNGKVICGTDATGGGGSGSNWDIVSGGLETATTTDFARAAYFIASSTSATSTFPIITNNTFRANTSAGVDIDSGNGTHIANFGVGNSANSIFYGGVNIDGQTRIATSISGLIKATSGILSAAVSGTDYVATTSGNWAGTFDGLEGTSFLARANHTGTQLAATISDFVSTVRTSISETITGLTYTSATGVLSLDGGYVIPLTASTTEWSTAYASTTNLTPTYIRNLFSNTATGLTYTAGTGVTALTAGYNIPLSASTTNWNTFYDTPSNRITAGNHIDWTANTLDVVTTGDWTGTVDGNNFAGGAIGSGQILYGSGAGTLAELSLGASSTILTNNGTTPLWATGSSLCVSITGSADLCDGNDATGGGGGTPAGSDTYLQYNNAGAFGALEQTNDAVRWMLDTGKYTLLVGTSSASDAKFEINNNDSTSARGLARLISTSNSGADYDIRLDSPDADIEFCDQTTTPNGCFEINSVAANNQLYITPRNGSDTSFNPPVFTVNRNSTNGQGSIGINTQYDTPGAMLEIAGTNTLPYILALTSIKGGTDGDAFSVSSTSRIRASANGATMYFGDYGSGNNIRIGEYNNADSDILDMFGAAGTRIADASTLFFSTVNTGIATLLGTWDFSGATVNLPDNAVVEADLKAVDTASDEECLTYESSVGDFEWQTCGSGGSGGGLSTTTPWTNGNLAYVTGLGTVGSVATGTLTENITGLEFSATQALVGGSAVLNLTSGYTVPTSTLINNLNSFYTTPSSVITAGTGIDWTGNTLNGVYTAGDALTLTGEDFDFDGGATPQGELGGTWASPTLDDSVAVTGWNLTTPTLTSFFGTPCTTGEFLTDISDTGAFTCAAGGGGGGGGALSTTTDIIGDGGSQAVSYVEGDVMFGGNSSTTAEFQLDDDGAKLIISSTTNSNATATLESSNNAQAVRIGDDSGVGMENIFSTAGDMITRFYGAIIEWIIDVAKTSFTGKVYVATTTYNGATTTDALVIDGFTNSGEWIQEFCTTPSGETTAVVADTLRGCGRYAYIEDAAGQLDFVAPTTGTSSYFRIRTGATGTTNAAGDGFGFGWGSGIDFGDIQKSQPAMEWAWRTDAMGNATSSIMVGGITDAITVSANYAVEPAQGFYVVGSSTQANWQFACNPSTGATTYINTNIATSTVTSLSATTNNTFVHWRLEVGGTSNTAVTAILKARTQSNQNFTEVGSCTINTSASTQLVAPTIGNGRVSAGTLSAEIHLMFLKFWYKQPVF